jgi:hypothetical protein
VLRCQQVQDTVSATERGKKKKLVTEIVEITARRKQRFVMSAEDDRF